MIREFLGYFIGDISFIHCRTDASVSFKLFESIINRIRIEIWFITFKRNPVIYFVRILIPPTYAKRFLLYYLYGWPLQFLRTLRTSKKFGTESATATANDLGMT
jgi:hypothetical protein